MMFRRIFRRKKEEAYVLDTSLFVNPDARRHFGGSIDEAVSGFLTAAAAAKAKGIRFYMTPSVRKELRYFAQKELPSFKNAIIMKSPSLYEQKIPAILMYKFLDEIRTRVNAGLRVSEKFVRDQKAPVEERLHRLRIQYKETLREGVLDSEEDFEVLMLAKGLNAAVVTLDAGLVKAAEELGVRCIGIEDFYAHVSGQQ